MGNVKAFDEVVWIRSDYYEKEMFLTPADEDYR